MRNLDSGAAEIVRARDSVGQFYFLVRESNKWRTRLMAFSSHDDEVLTPPAARDAESFRRDFSGLNSRSALREAVCSW